MSVYIGFFVALLLLRMAVATPTGRRRAFPWALIAVFLFSAFRFEVGCDWSGYEVHFDFGEEVPLDDIGREPLWWALVQLLQASGFSYLSLNVASSSIFFYGIYLLSVKQPDPLSFLIILFPVLIINLPMSGIRQATAEGILCLAFIAFTDRQQLKFAVLVSLAALFHTSAAIFLLLWPLIAMRITPVRAALAALLAVPAVVLLAATEAAQVAASRYVGTEVEAAGAIYRVGLLCLTGVVYFVFYRRVWKQESPADYSLVSIGAVIMIALPLGLLASGVISDRVGYYLVPIQGIILSRVPQLTTKSWARIASAAPYVVLGGVFVAWMVYSSLFELCYVPYESWLLGVPTTTRY